MSKQSERQLIESAMARFNKPITVCQPNQRNYTEKQIVDATRGFKPVLVRSNDNHV